MKIIDTHVHIGGEHMGFHMTEEMVLYMMEEYGISHVILSNSDSGELGNEEADLSKQMSQEDALRNAIRFAREHPGKISVAPWIRPYTQEITSEFIQLVKENLDVVKAVKFHPYKSNISPVDERLIPYWKMAAEFDLPVVSHTDNGGVASPMHVYEAAKMFPSIPFVMVHMGLCSDNSLALDLLGKLDNLYGDTTWVPVKTTIEAFRRYGNEKIVFGSDAPIDGKDTYLCNPWGERSLYQEYFKDLPKIMKEEDYEMLMHKNAERIFKIN